MASCQPLTLTCVAAIAVVVAYSGKKRIDVSVKNHKEIASTILLCFKLCVVSLFNDESTGIAGVVIGCLVRKKTEVEDKYLLVLLLSSLTV